MSDQRNRRVENVRLVRMPDGSLLTESQVAEKVKSSESLANTNIPNSTQNKTSHNPMKTKRTKNSLHTLIKNKMIDTQVKREKESRLQSSKIKTQKNNGAKKIEITLALPKVTKIPRLLSSRRTQIAAGLVVVIVVVAGATHLLDRKTIGKSDIDSSSVLSETSEQPQSKITLEKPKFRIYYPADKNEDTVGDIARTEKPGTPAVYSYIDNLGETQLLISQQEIPSQMKDNPAVGLEKAAKDLQMTNVIEINNEKVYHGLSKKDGVQSLALIKGNILMLVKANQKLSDDAWVAYLMGMQ